VLGVISGRILTVVKQSEESRVFLQEAYWHVGMEEIREQEKKVSRRIEGLARYSGAVSKFIDEPYINHYVNRYVNYVNYEAVLTRGTMLGRRHPEVDARAFSYDAGDVSPLVWCISDSVGRSLYTTARNLNIYSNFPFS